MAYFKQINVEAKVKELEDQIAMLTDQITSQNYTDHMRRIGALQLKIQALQQTTHDAPEEYSIPKTTKR